MEIAWSEPWRFSLVFKQFWILSTCFWKALFTCTVCAESLTLTLCVFFSQDKYVDVENTRKGADIPEEFDETLLFRDTVNHD